MLLPYGPWLPDQPDLGTATLIAKNVIAATFNPRSGAVSYKQFRSFANTISALAQRVQGAIAVKAVGAGAYIYAGTASTLQELSPGATSFTDRSKVGGYNCAADHIWGRARFGNGVYFANIADPIQVATIGAGTAFEDLSADAPKARYLATVNNFLMAANTWDPDDGFMQNRLWWPAINNPASWPEIGSDAAAAVQSDRQDLPDGGAISGIVGGETGVTVVCENKIIRGLFGSSLIFDFIPAEENRGSRYSASIIGDGRNVFYIGDDGFFRFNSVQSEPIGTQKVDTWFLGDLDKIHIPRVCAAIDPVNKLVMWAYPGTGHSLGNPSKLVIYNWAIDCWSYVDLPLGIEYLVAGLSLGYTLDGLDVLGFTVDNFPYSFDADILKGGEPLLLAFDTSHRMGAFTGSPMQATITTGEYQLSEGQRSLVTAVRPMVSNVGTSQTVTPITRNRQSASTTTGSASTENAAGVCPMMSEARYHRFQSDIVGGFAHAQGVEPTFSGSGDF